MNATFIEAVNRFQAAKSVGRVPRYEVAQWLRTLRDEKNEPYSEDVLMDCVKQVAVHVESLKQQQAAEPQDVVENSSLGGAAQAPSENVNGTPSSEPQRLRGDEGLPMIDYALDAVHRGFFIAPCVPGDKRPATQHGVLDATNDETQVRAWWTQNPNYNYLIACGASGIVVRDYDSIQPFSNKPATLRVRTGRNAVDGVHGHQDYYVGVTKTYSYRADGREVLPRSNPESCLRDENGMFVLNEKNERVGHPDNKPVGEVRGNGAYVIGYGSIHPSGNRYVIVNDIPLAQLPAEDVKQITPVKRGKTVGSEAMNETAEVIEQGLKSAGIEIQADTVGRDGEYKWHIHCPYEHESGRYNVTSSTVILFTDGRIVYVCQHASCSDKKWHEASSQHNPEMYLRDYIEEKSGVSLEFDKGTGLMLNQRADDSSPAAQQEQEIQEEAQARAQLDAWMADDATVALSSKDVIALSAKLGNEDFEDRRAKTAKKLGWRSSKVDEARNKLRPRAEEEDALQGRAFVLEEVNPWENPVNIAEVLDEIEKTLRRFVFFQRDEDVYTVSLWTAMTWLSALLAITPYLGIRSPEKGCGKSTLLKLISKLVYHPLAASNCTAAAMFRMLELHVLTMLIDELDTFMQYNPEVLNVFNSGHSREMAFVLRCVGDDAEARAFNTFGAKAYGMIGNATDTLESRSLPVILFPKIEEDEIEDLNLTEMHEVVTALQTLARKLARWANDNAQAVLAVKPDMKGTVNRKRDNWRPLFQIAEFAGHGWLDKARKAAGLKEVSEEKSANRQFLEDVRNIFLKRDVPFIPSNVLLADLHAQHESGWKHYGKGRDGMTQNDLGIFMKGYGVKSSRDYLGGSRLRGYYWSDLAPAFNRFLRNVPLEDVDLGNVGMPTADAVDLNKKTVN